MKVTLTQETNLSLEKVQLIHDLSCFLQTSFEALDYGEDVNQLLIGIICVKTEFDSFYKERKLRHIKVDRIRNAHGEIINMENSISYDIKLNYEFCIKSDQKEFQKLITSEIVKSLQKLDYLPKTIEDFDKNRFKFNLKKILASKQG